MDDDMEPSWEDQPNKDAQATKKKQKAWKPKFVEPIPYKVFEVSLVFFFSFPPFFF